jgi:hypothetical protein
VSITIYALCDPCIEDPVHRVRYIGQTRQKLNRRLSGHRAEARAGTYRRARWLRSLANPPVIVSLIVVDNSEADAAEIRQIALHKKMGCDLVNGTDGGGGMGMPNAETRAKMSVSQRRRGPRSAESKFKTSLALRGRPISEEKRIAIGNFHRGRKRSSETRARIGSSKRGVVCSEKTKEKIRASWRLRLDRLRVAALHG